MGERGQARGAAGCAFWAPLRSYWSRWPCFSPAPQPWARARRSGARDPCLRRHRGRHCHTRPPERAPSPCVSGRVLRCSACLLRSAPAGLADNDLASPGVMGVNSGWACSGSWWHSGCQDICVSSTSRFTKQHPFVSHVSVKILHARASPWHQSFLLDNSPRMSACLTLYDSLS